LTERAQATLFKFQEGWNVRGTVAATEANDAITEGLEAVFGSGSNSNAGSSSSSSGSDEEDADNGSGGGGEAESKPDESDEPKPLATGVSKDKGSIARTYTPCLALSVWH
jgi:hypothetical protein